MKNIILIANGNSEILEMEHTSNIVEGDNYDETHNNCTTVKCSYNPKEQNQNQSAGDVDVNIVNINKCIANFCVGCGVNMGDCNPRQYCYKMYCPFENMD